MINSKNHNNNYELVTNPKDTLSLSNFINESNKLFAQIAKEIDYITKIFNNLQLKKFEDSISNLKNLFKNYTDNFNLLALKLYEPQLRKYESELRNLFKINLMFQLQKEAMDNKFKILQQKNEEYEKLKKMTNTIVENGKFIFTDRKENEILILRAENSNLKKEIQKLEEKIIVKEEKENHLIQEYELTKRMLQKRINDLTYKIESLDPYNSNSSININFNDINHSNLFINNNTSSDNLKKNNKTDYNNLKMTKVNTTSNIFSERKPIKIMSPSHTKFTNKKLNKKKIKAPINIQHQRNNNKILSQEFSFPDENNSKNTLISPIKKMVQTFSPVNKKEKKNIIKNMKSNIKNNFPSYHKNKNIINLSQRDVNTLFMNSKYSVNHFLIYRNVLNTNNSGNSIINNEQTLNNGYFTVRSSSGHFNSNRDITNKTNDSYKSLNYLFKK